jgi:hypothetical protein
LSPSQTEPQILFAVKFSSSTSIHNNNNNNNNNNRICEENKGHYFHKNDNAELTEDEIDFWQRVTASGILKSEKLHKTNRRSVQRDL